MVHIQKRCRSAGTPVCKLWLPPHSLHADLNGDGVLDKVTAVSDDVHAHKGHHLHHLLQPCSAYVMSGYPPTTALFNGTICRSGRGASKLTGVAAAMESIRETLASRVEMAPPAALRAPGRASGAYGEHGGSSGAKTRPRPPPMLAVFLTSHGDLTAYDAHGARRWQRQTPATWVNAKDEAAGARVAPTLRAVPFFTHALPTAVLAAGATSSLSGACSQPVRMCCAVCAKQRWCGDAPVAAHACLLHLRLCTCVCMLLVHVRSLCTRLMARCRFPLV